MSKAPTRPSLSVTLAWGLVNIPVSLFSGTDKTGVTRKEFTGNGAPVGRALTNKDSGAVITSMDVVKMAQATSGAWVALGDDEIAAVTQPENRCVIETFIPLDTIGTHYLTEAWYQVRPKANKGVVEPVAEQGFALFMGAMAKHNVAALVKVAMRGPARYAVVLPDGRMATLLYEDGIRDALPMPTVELSAQHLSLADSLIENIGVATPSLTDTNGPAVQAYVDAKAAGKPAPAKVSEPVIAPDLMESLMASVSDAKAKGTTPVKAKAKTKAKPKA